MGIEPLPWHGMPQFASPIGRQSIVAIVDQHHPAENIDEELGAPGERLGQRQSKAHKKIQLSLRGENALPVHLHRSDRLIQGDKHRAAHDAVDLARPRIKQPDRAAPVIGIEIDDRKQLHHSVRYGVDNRPTIVNVVVQRPNGHPESTRERPHRQRRKASAMRSHRISLGMIATVAIAGLLTAGCGGSTTDTTTTTSSVVTVTETPPTSVETPSSAAIEPSADAATLADKGAMDGSYDTTAPAAGATTEDMGESTATVPPTGHGTGASEYLGDWQRHASSLSIDGVDGGGDQVGTLMMGAGAADTEEWAFTWTAESGVVTGTLTDQINLTGAGVGDLQSGHTFTATPQTDSAGTTVLVTSGLGDTGTDLT